MESEQSNIKREAHWLTMAREELEGAAGHLLMAGCPAIAAQLAPVLRGVDQWFEDYRAELTAAYQDESSSS